MELQLIQRKIYEIRGLKVMLDFDLAEIYHVETRILNQAVKRNIRRFPSDFMFQLTKDEYDSMKSQIVMSSEIQNNSSQTVMSSTHKHRGNKYLPFAFTEQGIAMLSGLLHSDIAVEMNISIMRAFVVLRQYALNYSELNRKLEDFMTETNMQFNDVYQALIKLAEQKKLYENRKPIGFPRKIDKE
jgi:hypothetical protein